MKKIILSAMAAIAVISCGQKQEPQVSQEVQLDSLFSSIFPEDEPGAAVLILQGDSVVYDKGFGIADIGTKSKIDGNTSFNIASVSKQFTATAALQLVEKGLISLDDCVKKYCPEFKGDFYNEVKIKHLLSHSSGIPDNRGYIPREKKLFGDETLAMEYLPNVDSLNFAPGSAYEYINPTFLLVARIIEQVTGMNFADYVKENIFTPAGMDKTMYFEADKQELIVNMAHGYEYADVTDMPEERTAAATSSDEPKNWYELDYGEETFFTTKADGGIYTSTHEFVKWEYALRENKVMSEASRIDAQTPKTYVTGSPYSDYQNRENTWYGYGWFIEPETDSTRTVIYHTGDNGGFKILAARYPDTNSLVLVFSNRADWDRYQVKCDVEKILHL